MDEPGYIVMTGATGHLGKHLLARLLRRGYRVGAVVRDHGADPEERIASLLAGCGADLEGVLDRQLEIIPGDVTRPLCGLSCQVIAHLAEQAPRGVIHAAGAAPFAALPVETLRELNFQGTVNTYLLGRELRIPAFHHLSTVTVAGDYPGILAAEDPIMGQRFPHPWAESKFAAETYLIQAARRHPQRIVAHRLGVISGGNATERVSDPVHAVLGVLDFLSRCARQELANSGKRLARSGVALDGSRIQLPLLLPGDPATSYSLTSVERLAATVVAGVEREWFGFTAVHPDEELTLTLGQLVEEASLQLGITGVTCAVDDGTPPSVTPLQGWARRVLRSSLPYLERWPRVAATAGWWEPPVAGLSSAAVVAAVLSRLEPAPGAALPLTQLLYSCLWLSTPEHYLERVAAGDCGREFLRRNCHLTALIRLVIEPGGSRELGLRLEGGVFTLPAPGELERADCELTLSRADFFGIMRGELNPRHALFKGGIRLEGDRNLGTRFIFALGDYLSNGDERILDELAG